LGDSLLLHRCTLGFELLFFFELLILNLLLQFFKFLEGFFLASDVLHLVLVGFLDGVFVFVDGVFVDFRMDVEVVDVRAEQDSVSWV